jgi:ribonuclease HI
VFSRAVWEESRSFFQAVADSPVADIAAARVAEVASLRYEDELWRLQRGGAYGASSKRSPAQREKALSDSLRVIGRLVAGGIYVYTDGASNGNPGHSGAGVCFAGAGTGLGDQSWALGKSTNNIAELFAIGAAAESIMVARAAGLAPNDRAFILTDSDTNLSRLARPADKDDSLLLRQVRRAVELCRAQGPLGLIWVPGHVGVEGNERADECAGAGAINSMRMGVPEPCGSAHGDFLTDHHASEIRFACARILRGV